MSQYYKAKSTWGIYDPESKEPHKLSRSKLDLFLNCERCFYLDQRIGVKRPASFPLTLNNAVDYLMKKEYDAYRENGEVPPIAKENGIDAVPFNDPKMEEWRDALKRGVSCLHKKTNIILRGGVDDVWINIKGELIVVDYKATSNEKEITLDDEWKIQYKRQMEIYQWLLKQNGYKVSDTGYFVYVNAKTNREGFDNKLDFETTIIPYEGKTDWIEKEIIGMKKCLDLPNAPKANADCDYCNYRKAAGEELLKLQQAERKQTKKLI
jgi:CRISPR/Cas system-associated exonuclease Cas4 (RecB family)